MNRRTVWIRGGLIVGAILVAIGGARLLYGSLSSTPEAVSEDGAGRRSFSNRESRAARESRGESLGESARLRALTAGVEARAAAQVDTGETIEEGAGDGANTTTLKSLKQIQRSASGDTAPSFRTAPVAATRDDVAHDRAVFLEALEKLRASGNAERIREILQERQAASAEGSPPASDTTEQ